MKGNTLRLINWLIDFEIKWFDVQYTCVGDKDSIFIYFIFSSFKCFNDIDFYQFLCKSNDANLANTTKFSKWNHQIESRNLLFAIRFYMTFFGYSGHNLWDTLSTIYLNQAHNHIKHIDRSLLLISLNTSIKIRWVYCCQNIAR